MLKDIPTLEKRIRKLKPIPQSIVASYIWWKLCDRMSIESMAGIKSMINYHSPQQSPEYIEDVLHKFGFTADQSERAVKSLRTLLKYRSEMVNK